MSITQASDFLALLTGGGQVTFQTFDDSKQKRPHLNKIIHGRHKDNLEKLMEANQQGAGVFVMVNEGDSKGRTTKNVVRVRALFVDLDGSPLEPVLAAGLTPHMTVESSAGRFHAYWLVDDCPLDQFKPLQQALAQKFNGDVSVCDLPRVMRVCGFLHQKGEPFQTRILSINEDLPAYSVADFAEIIELPKPKADTATKRVREGRLTDGQKHTDFRTYAVGLRKSGLTIDEVRTLAEKRAYELCGDDTRSLDDMLKWLEKVIEPDENIFSDLVRVLTVPVVWRLNVWGLPLLIPSTKELVSYQSLRRLIMEQLGQVPPMLSAKAWNTELEKLMEDSTVEEMPEEMTPLGMAWNSIIWFLTGKVQGRAKQELMMGRPWTDVEEGRVYFVTKDIHKYFSQQRIFLPPHELGLLLRQHGGRDTTYTHKGKTTKVWWVPYSEVEPHIQKEDYDDPPPLDGVKF